MSKREKINDDRSDCGTCGNPHNAGEHRSDLLACPFCGYPPIYRRWHGAPFMIECDYDGCDVSPSATGGTRAEVTARWNTRVGRVNAVQRSQ